MMGNPKHSKYSELHEILVKLSKSADKAAAGMIDDNKNNNWVKAFKKAEYELKALINKEKAKAELEGRIQELRNVDCGDDDDDEQLVQWAFDHMYSTMDGRSIDGRIKHLEAKLSQDRSCNADQ